MMYVNNLSIYYFYKNEDCRNRRSEKDRNIKMCLEAEYQGTNLIVFSDEVFIIFLN